jgi:hypothetical protein
MEDPRDYRWGHWALLGLSLFCNLVGLWFGMQQLHTPTSGGLPLALMFVLVGLLGTMMAGALLGQARRISRLERLLAERQPPQPPRGA